MITKINWGLINVLLGLSLLLAVPHISRAQPADAKENSFLPTWKLLSSQEKQHFVSGYIQGWNDARKVTDIALEYIKTNPTRAVESLESIRKLYDMSHLTPENLVEHIDKFYEDPKNHSSSLSVAVTAARGQQK